MQWESASADMASRVKAAGINIDALSALNIHLETSDAARSAALIAALNARCGGLCEATYLFDSRDDDDLLRFVKLRFPDVDADLAGSVAFDWAHQIAEAFDLVSAEPDLPSDIFVEPKAQPDVFSENAEQAIVKALCEVESDTKPPKRWATEQIAVEEAMQYSETNHQKKGGSGILVAQPDTGILPNPEIEAGAVDASGGWDVLLDRAGAKDPLLPGHPGHGTATGSCVVGRGAGSLIGAAPAATLYPIRCITAVTVFNAGPVARAIEKAIAVNADVVTMSLGGVGSRAMRAALKKAIDKHMIVLAAAGNCVRLVVWPARYPECIAVGGSNFDKKPWKGSCRGKAVDITAPAEMVWHASTKTPSGIDDGQGTSFAVALTAGAAAQWLAHHTKDKVKREAIRLGVKTQDVFRYVVGKTATRSAFLDSDEFGPGIVHIERLLKFDLASITSITPPRELPGDDPGDGVPPEYVEIYRAFGGAEAAPQINWARHGLELSTIALRRASEAKATGAEMAETTSPQPSVALAGAVQASADGALRRWAGTEAAP